MESEGGQWDHKNMIETMPRVTIKAIKSDKNDTSVQCQGEECDNQKTTLAKPNAVMLATNVLKGKGGRRRRRHRRNRRRKARRNRRRRRRHRRNKRRKAR